MKRIILVLLVAACFGQNGLHDFAPSLGRGLNVNVVGGVAAISTVPTAIAGTSVGVAANTTTYIYVDLSAAIISSNTSGFTSTEYPVATVVTNSTQIVTLTDDRPGAYAVSGGGGSGTVSSVSNSDGTLTITPTTGAVIAALALAHANTWTGQQTFVAPILGTPASGIITNLTGTCTSCTSNLAVNISTNGTANQVWGMNSGATAQGWQTVSAAGANTSLSNLVSPVANVPIGLPAGTVSAPSIFDSTDVSTGIYFDGQGAGSIDFVLHGTENLQLATAAHGGFQILPPICDYATSTGCLTFASTGITGSVPVIAPIYNLVQTSGSPYTLAATPGTYWNNTASTFMWNLIAPPANAIQQCFGNYHARTGVLSILPSSGVTIYFKGVAGTAGSGTGLVSGGAAGDFICVEATDATTYEAIGAGVGTWTNH
jgi:hypothetical protein